MKERHGCNYNIVLVPWYLDVHELSFNSYKRSNEKEDMSTAAGDHTLRQLGILGIISKLDIL